MFVDEVEVMWQAGNGGDGCCSFRREKYIPKGGPDGGDGGKGGDVVIEGSPHINDLRQFRYKPHAHAQNGQPGMGSDCYGHNGKDCVLQVPLGTQVLEADTERMVTEVVQAGQQVIVLKGGRGGLGNLHFKSSVNRAPSQITPGQPGQTGRFKLVLKTLADVGLVGLPNAGKSSLIRRLTQVQPKVAPYPFTTLHPHVGVLMQDGQRLLIADIPGLIEGASKNKGLGFQFLRHIERCSALLFVLDFGQPDVRHVWRDFKILRAELKQYGEHLTNKPFMVVANKNDLLGFKKNKVSFCRKFPTIPVFSVSCVTGEGIDGLAHYLLENFVSNSRPIASAEQTSAMQSEHNTVGSRC